MLRNDSVFVGNRTAAFYWRGCSKGDHISAAVDASVAALTFTGNRLNMIQEADARAQIKNQLKRACSGKLRSTHHVKRIQSQPAIHMYELRWNHLAVNRYDMHGLLIAAGDTALLRLYYTEFPPRRWGIGLHVHEKLVLPDPVATAQRQDSEISRAVALLHEGAPTHWDVRELDPILGEDIGEHLL